MLSLRVLGSFRLSKEYCGHGNSPWRGVVRAFGAHHERTQNADLRTGNTLKDVTIIEGVNDAVPVVKKLMELGPERNVAWSTQIMRNPQTGIIPSLTMSAYAGKDVDFGNGPHLFIRSQDEAEGGKIWKLLKSYFEDELCTKVWFNYPSMRKVFVRQGIGPCGFGADVVSMASLTTEPVKHATLDGLAEVFLKPTDLCKDISIPAKSALKRPCESTIETAGAVADAVWIGRACADAALIYSLFERLREMLKSSEIQGANSTLDFQSEFGNLYEVYNNFFAPLVVQLYEMQTHGMSVNKHVLDGEENRNQDEMRAREARFLQWACEFSPDAAFMDTGSSRQLRQLLFAPCDNIYVKTKCMAKEDSFVRSDKKGQTDQAGLAKRKKGAGKEKFVLQGRGAEAKVYTAAGWPSGSAAALRKAAGYPRAKNRSYGQQDQSFCLAVDDLLAARSLKDNPGKGTNETMTEQLIESDGRVHLGYKMDSKTGEIACFHGDSESLDVVRRALCATPGNTLLVGKYVDMELSMLGHLSGCDALRTRLEHGPRKYEVAAMGLFDHVKEAVHEGKCVVAGATEMRHYRRDLPTIADAFPLEYLQSVLLDSAIATGKSEKAISDIPGVEFGSACVLIRRWYVAHPGVQEWRNRCVNFAKREGFLETLSGRRKVAKNVNARHGQHRSRACAAAIAYAVSGSCGEAVMGAVVNLGNDETLTALGWRVVFVDGVTVVMEGPEHAADVAKPIVERIMREPMDFDLDVMFEVDVEARASMDAVQGNAAAPRGEVSATAHNGTVEKSY